MTDFSTTFGTNSANSWPGWTRLFPNTMVFSVSDGLGYALPGSDFNESGVWRAGVDDSGIIDKVWRVTVPTQIENYIALGIAAKGADGSKAITDEGYFAQIDLYGSAREVSFKRRVGGVSTNVSPVLSLAPFQLHPAAYWVRQRLDAGVWSVKVWLEGTPEPAGFQSVYVDPTPLVGRGDSVWIYHSTGAGAMTFDGPATYVAPVSGANAGPDQTVAATATVTLTGTPARGADNQPGVWTQVSGPAVALSAPVTDATSTNVTFATSNPSTTTPLDRAFTYTV